MLMGKRLVRFSTQLLFAFGFLTAFPGLGRLRVEEEDPGKSSAFFILPGLLLGGGVLLYLPFWVGFQSQAGGVLLNLFNATRLVQFLVMFAPLLLLVAAFVVDRARGARVRASGVGRWTVRVALSVLLSLAVVVGLFLALVRVGALSPRGPASYVAAWARGDPIPGLEDVPDASARVAQSLRARLLNPWTALGLTALLVTIVLTLERTSTGGGDEQFAPPPSFSERSKLSGADRFALLLCATGALLTLGVEYVYLADSFGTRMNTVFKFYFQAWVLWAIAGAYALAGFVRRGRAGLVAVAGCLILAGLLYPALAIPARAAEYGGPPTLDGAAYLAQAYPQDYAAIAWLNENVAGAPVILEAPGDQFKSYVYEGRVSAHTGLPTLLGWGGHEHQWRGSYEEQARREPDIERLYNSVDPGEVLALLERYGVRYVYVGPLERQRYSPSGLAKFAGLLDVVYEADGVTIYERTP